MIFVNEAHLADITVTMFACDIFWVCGTVAKTPININLRGADNVRQFLHYLELDFGSFSVFDMSERIHK